MPLPLLQNVGHSVENIFDLNELLHRVNESNIEGQLVKFPETEQPAPMPSPPPAEKPMRVVEPLPVVEDPMMARVYQSFVQNRPQEAQPLPAPLPVPRPRPVEEAPPAMAQRPTVLNPMAAYYGMRPTGVGTMPSLVIGAPSTGPNIDQLPNPKKGICRFFNTSQGCQSGSRCRFTHACSQCGSEEHSIAFHEDPSVPRDYYRY
jgi:hypothetical protein